MPGIGDVAKLVTDEPRIIIGVGKAAEDDHKIFEMVFGFIPTINIGTALGFEGAPRIIADILLDPTWLLTSGATAAARTARAGQFLSQGKRAAYARKAISASAYLAESPALKRQLELAISRGDVQTLGRFKDLFNKEHKAVKKLFAGREGRAIERAIMTGSEDFVVGASRQAAAGQRRLLGLRVPLTDHEITVVGGQKVFKAVEGIPGIGGFFRNMSHGKQQALRRLAFAAEPAVQAADEIVGAAEHLTRVADDTDLVAEAERLRAEIRAPGQAPVPPHKLQQLEETEKFLAARREARQIVDDPALAKEVDELRTRSLEYSAQVDRYRLATQSPTQVVERQMTQLRALTHTPPTLRQLTPVLTRVAAGAAEHPDPARLFAEIAKIPPTKETEEVLKRIAANTPAPEDFPVFLHETYLEAQKASKTPEIFEPLLKQTKPAELALDVDHLAQLEKALQEQTLKVAKLAGAGVTKLGNLSADVGREVAERLIPVGESLTKVWKNAFDQEFGASIEGVLREAFPTLASRDRQAIRGILDGRHIDTDTTALVEDYIAAIRPSFSREFTGQGRSVSNLFGLEFSVLGIMDWWRGTSDQAALRSKAIVRRMAPIFELLAGKDPSKMARLEAKAVSKVPAGWVTDAGHFAPTLEGEQLSAVVLNRSRAELEGLQRFESAVLVPERAQTVENTYRTYLEAAHGRLSNEALLDDVSRRLGVTPDLGDIGGVEGWKKIRDFEQRMLADPYLADTAVELPDFAAFKRIIRDQIGVVPVAADPNAIAKGAHLRGNLKVLRADPKGPLGRGLEFIRAFNKPKLRASLSDHELAALEILDDLFTKAGIAIHGKWAPHLRQNYLPRIFRRAPGVSKARFEAALAAIKQRRASVTSRFFQERIVQDIDQLLELERQGLGTLETDVGVIVKSYLDDLSKVSMNQRLHDYLVRNRAMDGAPILIKGKHTAPVAISERSYIPIENVPALEGYSIHPDFQLALQAFGPQTLSEAISEVNPGFLRALFKSNLMAKGGLLSLSGFHFVALHQSILASTGVRAFGSFLKHELARTRIKNLTGAVKSPKSNTFLNLWGEAAEMMEYAVAHGLEMDTFEKFAQDTFTGFVNELGHVLKGGNRVTLADGRQVRAHNHPLTGLVHMNEMLHRNTWEIVHNSGKGFVWAHHLRNLLDDPKLLHLQPDELAQIAAQRTNSQMGGLAWRRIFGDSRARSMLQTMMLAPDWTIANFNVARDAMVGFFPDLLRKDHLGRFQFGFRDMVNPSIEAKLARQYWLNYAMTGFLVTQAINLAINGHLTFSNPGDDADAKFSVFTGKYDEKNGQPIFALFGKQFREPFQLVWNGPHGALEFFQRKASPLAQTFTGVVFGRDRFGRPITQPEDSTGVILGKYFGYVTGAGLPIPINNIMAVLNRDHYTALDLLNVASSSFDLSFRRLKNPKTKEEQEEALIDELGQPSTINRKFLPARQSKL